ncbi:MAG: S-layer homology domain-containing protein [Actinobacteria bacterium]|nr:S-layer homology domain-containing protein [Actinomycetota bacterium]
MNDIGFFSLKLKGNRRLLALFMVISMLLSLVPLSPAYAKEQFTTPMASAGYLHSLALKPDGTVWAWGDNGQGQLGDGTTTDKHTPVPVSGPSGITAITAGDDHSLALKSDGTVWAWGRNSRGQLGDGTTTRSLTPVPVSGLSEVIAVAAGADHSLALKPDGTVWAWGSNYFGELGNETMTRSLTPVPVSGLSEVIAVAAGDFYSLALKSDGTIWAWGYNASGQLGDGTTTYRSTPAQISELSGITAIAAGSGHSLALKSDGTVWAWGRNSRGQLGDGTTTRSFTPVPVSGLSEVIAVAAGIDHSLALKSDGTVWAWGYNASGQLGDGTTINYTPVKVDIIPPAWPADSTLTASNITETSLTLSWSEDAGDAGVMEYRIYKDGALLATVEEVTTVYNVTGLTPNTTYEFKVEAVDLGGYRTNAPSALLTTKAIATTPPDPSASSGGNMPLAIIKAPTNLKATAIAFDIALSWDKVEAANGYNIYRKEGTGPYLKLNAALVTSNAYTDSTAKTGITYTYYVTAVGSDGKESGRSNEVSFNLILKEIKLIFSDVPPDAWYEDFVLKLISLGIINGYSDGTFRPDENVPRAEFTKMICLAMGWSLEDPDKASFPDIAKGNWAYKYIETAKAHGVIHGYPDGTFSPGRNITRAEIAKIIAKTLNLPSGASTFTDISTHWAKDYICSCAKAGIVNGYPDNTFRPNSTATRAEAAKMIAGVLDNK